MNIQQLRYVVAVANNQLNISKAAGQLCVSQSGVSKQILLFEAALGMDVFSRHGKQLVAITQAGQQIIAQAKAVLQQLESLENIAAEIKKPLIGALSIATTHTQARYRLPPVVTAFMQQYPAVSLHIHQGSPTQIAQMAASGEVDFAIATEALEQFSELTMMPCYTWNRGVVVQKDHPLAKMAQLSLADIAQYPLITYVFGFTGRSKLDAAFNQAGITPNVVFTAADADVIKTYVKYGLGVGIIAAMAFDPIADSELVMLDVSHLFEASTTSIGFRRDIFLRGYMYDFIALFAPHLTHDMVEQCHAGLQSPLRQLGLQPLPRY